MTKDRGGQRGQRHFDRARGRGRPPCPQLMRRRPLSDLSSVNGGAVLRNLSRPRLPPCQFSMHNFDYRERACMYALAWPALAWQCAFPVMSTMRACHVPLLIFSTFLAAVKDDHYSSQIHRRHSSFHITFLLYENDRNVRRKPHPRPRPSVSGDNHSFFSEDSSRG